MPSEEFLASNVELLQDWIVEIADGANPQSVVDKLNDCTFEMWLPYDGDRFVGMVITYKAPNRPCLEFLGAAGDVMNNYEGLHNSFVALARDRGCTSYEFKGRRGFLRAFKKFGMTERYTVMECRFED